MNKQEILYRPLTEVKPYENNPRFNDNAVDVVANSIKEFGFQQPIVIDQDGVIVAGHTRWKAARKLKLESVPVIVMTDASPEQVKAYRLADNKTGELAEWDFDKLEKELEEIQMDMEPFGFEYQDEEETQEEGKEYTPESVATDIADKLQKADNVLIQCTGGKDSTLVLLWAKAVCKTMNQTPQAIYYVKKMMKEEKDVILIPVCPEMLGGLPVPRPPAKRIKGRVYETCPEKENRKFVTGPEITDQFENGALQVLRRASEYNCKRAVLCKFSPSCDRTGITGKLLSEHGIEIINVF